MILKILIKINTNEGLALEASSELVERLSIATLVQVHTDYKGNISHLSKITDCAQMLLLTEDQFQKLSAPIASNP